MKKLSLIFLIAVFSVAITGNTNAQFGKIIKSLTGQDKKEDSNTNQDDGDVVGALKQALEIGSKNAVDILSVKDGYFGNQLVKILVPDNLRNIEPTLRTLGLGSKVDEFVLSMNRAAESASKEAVPIFVDAVKGITFDDAMKILNGGDNAATNYFKEKTSQKLTEKFKPIVSNSMNSIGVTKIYKEITGKIASNPFISLGNTDLDSYVTQKALDGLFKVIAQEETKIRTDPAARVTDLLKDIFGG